MKSRVVSDLPALAIEVVSIGLAFCRSNSCDRGKAPSTVRHSKPREEDAFKSVAGSQSRIL